MALGKEHCAVVSFTSKPSTLVLKKNKFKKFLNLGKYNKTICSVLNCCKFMARF